MNKVRLIASENKEDFQKEVNNFLQGLNLDQVTIQYTTTPTAIATHTEYGVYPSIEYSALIQYKE